MKNLNKILIIPIVSIGIILNFASADRSDCGTFGKLPYSQGWTANWFEIVNNSRETNQNRFTNFLIGGLLYNFSCHGFFKFCASFTFPLSFNLRTNI